MNQVQRENEFTFLTFEDEYSDFEELPVLENRPREMITEKKESEKGKSRILESILRQVFFLFSSANFFQAQKHWLHPWLFNKHCLQSWRKIKKRKRYRICLFRQEPKQHQISLDDMNWESCDSFQSSRPPTQVLMDCRRMSADDNIIGLRLGKNYQHSIVLEDFRSKSTPRRNHWRNRFDQNNICKS